jgi:hypothetical protein
VAYAAHDFGGILLDLHPAAAAVAFLPSLQLKIDFIEIDRHIAGKPFNNGGKLRSVRFSCG